MATPHVAVRLRCLSANPGASPATVRTPSFGAGTTGL
jgi:hypothetical protein